MIGYNCKGCWALGTACGTCERCIKTKPKKKHEDELMIVDPRNCKERPYPSHAGQFRDFHGFDAWIYNPWTKVIRDSRDIASDPTGLLIEA